MGGPGRSQTQTRTFAHGTHTRWVRWWGEEHDEYAKGTHGPRKELCVYVCTCVSMYTRRCGEECASERKSGRASRKIPVRACSFHRHTPSARPSWLGSSENTPNAQCVWGTPRRPDTIGVSSALKADKGISFTTYRILIFYPIRHSPQHKRNTYTIRNRDRITYGSPARRAGMIQTAGYTWFPNHVHACQRSNRADQRLYGPTLSHCNIHDDNPHSYSHTQTQPCTGRHVEETTIDTVGSYRFGKLLLSNTAEIGTTTPRAEFELLGEPLRTPAFCSLSAFAKTDGQAQNLIFHE